MCQIDCQHRSRSASDERKKVEKIANIKHLYQQTTKQHLLTIFYVCLLFLSFFFLIKSVFLFSPATLQVQQIVLNVYQDNFVLIFLVVIIGHTMKQMHPMYPVKLVVKVHLLVLLVGRNANRVHLVRRQPLVLLHVRHVILDVTKRVVRRVEL